MPRVSNRKKRELRAIELRAILDPAKHDGYRAELERLEQWLALDDELSAWPQRPRGRPKRLPNGGAMAAAPKRRRGRPPKYGASSTQVPARARRKRGRPRKVLA